MPMRTSRTLMAIIASVFISNQSLAGDCGSKEAQLPPAAKFVIPNKFPPDSPVLKALVVISGLSSVDSCEALFGRAAFDPACREHDTCYDIPGSSKSNCDVKLRQGWEASCGDQYRNRFTSVLGVDVPFPDNPERTACRIACVSFAGVMSEAQRVNEAGSCPSCVAYDNAQSKSLVWSFAGPIAGKHCVQINEPADPDTWNDNFLCSTIDLGIRWSFAGPIGGMRCTQINEPADPHKWNDNFLCVPTSSPFQFAWSFAGPIFNKHCVQIVEPADHHTWNDNFLCY